MIISLPKRRPTVEEQYHGKPKNYVKFPRPVPRLNLVTAQRPVTNLTELHIVWNFT